MVKPFDLLMQREMTRQDFMLSVGLMLASIMGINKILHLFTGSRINNAQEPSSKYSYTGIDKL